jgi:signal transduction histidine kinase
MPGGGKLTIETANARLDDDYARAYDDVRPGQYVMIAVTDTGAGMTPDVLERAFDPFFTTKDVGKGTGQGLAIARSIVVDKHGGKIEVDSALGQGTAFTVWLPVEADAMLEGAA